MVADWAVLRSRSLRELFNEVGLKLNWESPETTAPKFWLLVAGPGNMRLTLLAVSQTAT